MTDSSVVRGGNSTTNDAGNALSPPKLTLSQMDRLIKAMGRDAFRCWFEDYRHGRRQETVEELMNVLDTIGEDLFRQYYFAESASLSANSTPAVARLDTGGVGTANQLATQLQVLPPEPVANHTLLNNDSSAGGNELSQPALPTTSLVAANSTPPHIAPPADPTSLLDLSQIPPTAPLPPAVLPTKCEKCGEEVPADYRSRRAHVVEGHGLVEETAELATQEALKRAVGECFPDSVVRNDLMCNHPGCEKEVVLFKSYTGRDLQHFHVQQFHLAMLAGNVSPLSCPVRSCDKWDGARRDYHSLRNHLRNVHKGVESMAENDATASRQYLGRLKAATNDALSHFFPHTPKGLLCVGLSSKTKTARAVLTDGRLPYTRRQGLSTIEESESDCNECGEDVPDSYVERRRHAIEEHMEGGKLPSGSLLGQQDTLQMQLRRCFPNAIVVNDLMCNRCGTDLKDMRWVSMQDLQRLHVQQHHFESVEEKAKIKCPVADCSNPCVIPHLRALNGHLTNVHGGVQMLSLADKSTYEKIRDRVSDATAKLLPDCFPHTPPGWLTRKRKAE